MKIAFIPPLSHLWYTQKTNYQLCLPELMYSQTYMKQYKAYSQSGNHFVILDNGAAEGKLVDPTTLVDLGIRLRVSEVVIPDIMGDKNGTIEAAKIFYDEVVPPRHMAPLPFSFMFVVQGQTMMEVLESANWAAQQSWISTLGIPRHLPTTLGDSEARTRVANVIQGHNYRKHIHFLGANSEVPTEILKLSDPLITTQQCVRGMDTSMPFNYAYMGEYVDDIECPKVARPEGYFQLEPEKFNIEVLEHNINYFMSFCDKGAEG